MKITRFATWRAEPISWVTQSIVSCPLGHKVGAVLPLEELFRHASGKGILPMSLKEL
jgi:hypothetical protein